MPFIEAPTAEVARFLEIAVSGTAGKTLFKKIDLVYGSIDDEVALTSTHMNRGGVQAVRVAMYRAAGDGAFEVATHRPDHLLDFLNGPFAGEQSLRLVPDEADGEGKLKVSAGSLRAAVALCSQEEIGRPKRSGMFGFGPNRSYVYSDPSRRPTNGADWSAWAEKGYAIGRLDPDRFRVILDSARILVAHGCKNTILNLGLGGGIVNAAVADMSDFSADSVRFESLERSVSLGPPLDIPILFTAAAAQLSTLSRVNAKEIVVVRHPGEPGISFVATESDDKGVVLSATQIVSGWADARVNRWVERHGGPS